MSTIGLGFTGALGSHGADDIGLDLWQVSLGLSDLSLGRDPSYLGPSHHRSCPSYTVCVGNFGSLLLLGGGGVNDILHAQQRIDTAFIAPYTFIAFVLVQAGLIAQKFAYAFEERDASQRALLESYEQLDEELLRREKLLEVNTRLQEENRIASEQLIQADKLATLGTMVAGVAHDIANPTGLITMNQERALEASLEGEVLLDACFSDAEDEETLRYTEPFRRITQIHAMLSQRSSLAPSVFTRSTERFVISRVLIQIECARL